MAITGLDYVCERLRVFLKYRIAYSVAVITVSIIDVTPIKLITLFIGLHTKYKRMYEKTNVVQTLLINIGCNETFTLVLSTNTEPTSNDKSLTVSNDANANRVAFGVLNHIPHNTKLENILSANGSSKVPNLVTALYFLAIYPSKKSLTAPNNIIAIAKDLYPLFKNSTEIKADTILKMHNKLGTILT